jgi:hypothetical protein
VDSIVISNSAAHHPRGCSAHARQHILGCLTLRTTLLSQRFELRHSLRLPCLQLPGLGPGEAAAAAASPG